MGIQITFWKLQVKCNLFVCPQIWSIASLRYKQQNSVSSLQCPKNIQFVKLISKTYISDNTSKCNLSEQMVIYSLSSNGPFPSCHLLWCKKESLHETFQMKVCQLHVHFYANQSLFFCTEVLLNNTRPQEVASFCRVRALYCSK